MNRTQQGFSLIELLVVIAIIGILVSMIGAGLVKAKGSAKNVQCISNLKQLGLASQMYWDDNDQRTFAYSRASGLQGRLYWFGWLGDGIEGSRPLDHSMGVLWSYIGGNGIQTCPSFRYQDPLYKPKAMAASFGYGYNLHLTQSKPGANRIDDQGGLMTQLPSPANTALFADSAQINDFQSPASRDYPLIEEFYYINHGPATYANGHFRHGGLVLAAFSDGHVSFEKPEKGTRDMRLPSANTARLRKEILVP
ncbi:MAG: type II secretion system protein [Verrucomicrobia bacterium]|nr:type II secretion system protein [Verrucomicrobiota bacterium]